ncbi:MAG: site-2 protease family protein [bacterium]
MFGKSIKIFTLFGFEVKIDLSWIIIAFLIVWSLTVGFFPFQYKGLSIKTYWFMGIIGGLGLFLSIIFHEFWHSIVARKFGLPMKGITLFIFGGVAEMNDEPPSPFAEFTMAIAGPLSSIALAFMFYGMFTLGKRMEWPVALNGIIAYLATINGVLAAFNLVPAFPLDGGRVLRSILWGIKKDLRWATRVSSRIGMGFGTFLIVLAVLQIIRGNFIVGMWWFLIGLFLRNVANMSYQQLLLRQGLEGEPIRRFMKTDPITVSPSTSIKRLVEDYIYQLHYKMFPVVNDSDRLIGCVATKQVKDIPKEEWGEKTVGDILTQCSQENTISPNADAVKALTLMNQTDSSRLMVTEGNHLVGVIALKDMLKFLSLKVEPGEKF